MHLKDLLVEAAGFSLGLGLRVLHGLTQGVDARVDFIALPLELVTAEGLAPNQVNFLECLLLCLAHMGVEVVKGHELRHFLLFQLG